MKSRTAVKRKPEKEVSVRAVLFLCEVTVRCYSAAAFSDITYQCMIMAPSEEICYDNRENDIRLFQPIEKGKESMNIKWDSRGCTDKFDFVHKYGEDMLELIDAGKGSLVAD